MFLSNNQGNLFSNQHNSTCEKVYSTCTIRTTDSHGSMSYELELNSHILHSTNTSSTPIISRYRTKDYYNIYRSDPRFNPYITAGCGGGCGGGGEARVNKKDPLADIDLETLEELGKWTKKKKMRVSAGRSTLWCPAKRFPG
ncbi:hypothetical protein COOONC_09989 [Cooperia oncophora]